MPASPEHLAIEALNAARRWGLSRHALKRVLDSKSATPAAVEAAKREYNKAADDLEKVVTTFEALLAKNGTNLSAKAKKAPTGDSKPFPWQSLFGAVSAGASALEKAIKDGNAVARAVAGVDDDFIRAEVVDEPRKK